MWPPKRVTRKAKFAKTYRDFCEERKEATVPTHKDAAAASWKINGYGVEIAVILESIGNGSTDGNAGEYGIE
jgi:hypothetical protein